MIRLSLIVVGLALLAPSTALAQWAQFRGANAGDVADDPALRDEIASRFAEAELFRRYMQHIASQLAAGTGVGSRSSLVKLYWSELDSRIQETALQILGPFAELADSSGCAAGAGFHRNTSRNTSTLVRY